MQSPLSLPGPRCRLHRRFQGHAFVAVIASRIALPSLSLPGPRHRHRRCYRNHALTRHPSSCCLHYNVFLTRGQLEAAPSAMPSSSATSPGSQGPGEVSLSLPSLPGPRRRRHHHFQDHTSVSIVASRATPSSPSSLPGSHCRRHRRCQGHAAATVVATGTTH